MGSCRERFLRVFSTLNPVVNMGKDALVHEAPQAIAKVSMMLVVVCIRLSMIPAGSFLSIPNLCDLEGERGQRERCHGLPVPSHGL